MDAVFRRAAEGLMGFIQASPSPFHAIANTQVELAAAGFAPLLEGDPWHLEPGGRYLVTRNGSSVAAFVMGGEMVAESGFRIIGAHTDSPCLRLKPDPVLQRHGYVQLGVEVYGGPILASWLDRDLGLAGRVVIQPAEKAAFGSPRRSDSRTRPAGKAQQPAQGSRELSTRLFRVDRPIARVPEVAIHLDREVNEKGLLLNRETQLPPVIALSSKSTWDFRAWLAAELKVGSGQILDADLMLFDLTPPTLAGINEEFVFASRLDNLASSYAAVRALCDGASKRVDSTRLIVLYDSEEIGSFTKQGAAGTFLGELLERISLTSSRSRSERGDHREILHRARSRSWFLSADMAHAVHPNYPEKHDSNHGPVLNGGPVVKYSAAQRYATDAESAAFFRTICQRNGVPCQKFVTRADMQSGSTIGPQVATRLGLRTVDVGSAMLSMHSVRELAGSLDPLYMIRAMSGFLAG